MEKIVKLRVTRDYFDIRDSAECSYSVEQIMEILSRCPKDAKVVFSNDNGYSFGSIDGSTIRLVEVETKEEEEERIRKEEEEDERTHWVCPKCGGIDTAICSTSPKGGYHCCECVADFKQVIIKVDNE